MLTHMYTRGFVTGEQAATHTAAHSAEIGVTLHTMTGAQTDGRSGS